MGNGAQKQRSPPRHQALPRSPRYWVSPEVHGLWFLPPRKSQLDAELLLGLGEAEEGRGSRYEACGSSQSWLSWNPGCLAS